MQRDRPTTDAGLQYCENCQGPLPSENNFCPKCGTPRPRPINPFGPKNMGDIFGATFRVYSAGFIGIVIIVAMAEIPLSILSFWFGHVLESALEGAFGDFSSFDNFRVGILSRRYSGDRLAAKLHRRRRRTDLRCVRAD